MNAVYDALPFIRERRLRSVELPNALNFGFDYSLFLKVRPLPWQNMSCPSCFSLEFFFQTEDSDYSLFLKVRPPLLLPPSVKVQPLAPLYSMPCASGCL